VSIKTVCSFSTGRSEWSLSKWSIRNSYCNHNYLLLSVMKWLAIVKIYSYTQKYELSFCIH
jgi:hypothetical protein